MPIFMSEKSETLLKAAEQLSYKLGHYYVGCEHMFLSVLDNENWLSRALTKEGADADGIRQNILELAGPGDEEPLWTGLITTPRYKRVLKLAEKEAELQKSVRVQPNHLISAICREGLSVPARAMQDAGIDTSLFRQNLLQIDAASDSPAQGMAQRGTPVKYPPPGMPYGAFMEKKKQEGAMPPQQGREKDKKAKTPTLDKLGRDLVEMCQSGKVDPIVGRKEEIRRVLQTLTKKMKNNPIIIGEAGVGKTAVVYGLAERIAQGTVPDAVKNKRIIEVGMAGIVAGTKHRGEFEERMQQIINELMSNPDIILFIDEIHTIMGAGDSRSGVDAGNILKPYLARGEITIIGATTTDEYRKYIEKDPALERRFQPVFVEEPSEEETVEILKGLKGKYEKHHGVSFSPKAILQAVKMSVRYIPDRNLPDKAIDLMDEAAAKSTMKSMSDEDLDNMKDARIEVTEEDIAEVVALWTGIPSNKLTSDESERLLAMEDSIRDKVVGQDEAVRTVAQTIRMVRMGLSSPTRPSGVFLFLGPTGVGKTELAKGLAEFLFGSSKDIVRLDMSEYSEKHAMARMIGSPPGYVGHEEEGQLTKEIRTKPYSVVLLDEVEKAHPEVFDLFLQVFDDGRLTDSKGRTVNFTNTIIIMTSNIGTSNVDATGRIQLLNTSDPKTKEKIMQELRKHFRPEFLNRIDEIIIFNPLNEAALRSIVRINLNSLIKQVFEQREIRLVIDEDAANFLLHVGYDPAYGARPMKRAIQNYLSKPLAEVMLEQGISPGDEMHVSSDGNQLLFSRDGVVFGADETLSGDEYGGYGNYGGYDQDDEYGEEEEDDDPQPQPPTPPPAPPQKPRNPVRPVQPRDTDEFAATELTGHVPAPPRKQGKTDELSGRDAHGRPTIKPEGMTDPLPRLPQGTLSDDQNRPRQPIKRIPFETSKKQGDQEGPVNLPPSLKNYPIAKKPILKQRDYHQDIQGIAPMKGPIMGAPGMPRDIDERDFEDTRHNQ
ncbi:MAG: ATP-dependent Clp protease ATP-binding subunit [Firmicutes bacterium]|nr:ATP-dependent Clp protease ATP-binding subunit [Bacillota bacterium]